MAYLDESKSSAAADLPGLAEHSSNTAAGAQAAASDVDGDDDEDDYLNWVASGTEDVDNENNDSDAPDEDDK